MIERPDHNRYKEATSGALRVSLRHLDESFERLKKTQHRLEATESKDMRVEGQAGFQVTQALASIDKMMNDIKAELDKRDEPHRK